MFLPMLTPLLLMPLIPGPYYFLHILILILKFQPSVAHDGELVKAAKEVQHLREEESSLRQENLQLKVITF